MHLRMIYVHFLPDEVLFSPFIYQTFRGRRKYISNERNEKMGQGFFLLCFWISLGFFFGKPMCYRELGHPDPNLKSPKLQKSKMPTVINSIHIFIRKLNSFF